MIEVRVGIVRLAGVLESLKDRRVASEGSRHHLGKAACVARWSWQAGQLMV